MTDVLTPHNRIQKEEVDMNARAPSHETLEPDTVSDSVQVQSFAVEYAYPVVFTRHAFDPANSHLLDVLQRREAHKRHRVAIFIDGGVASALPNLLSQIQAYFHAHAEHIELVGEAVVLQGGEACKNDPELITNLLKILSDKAIDRHSYTLAIGGGAIMDAVGYAAAIFHRGVRHIRFPTTVLGQDDSGVGVKNAVNWLGLKNLVGTFAPPWAVINDGVFIDSLPEREKRCGMSEAVKVSLIRDSAFFTWLENNAQALARFDTVALSYLIKRSAQIHMNQIALGGDPFESGSARPLDYGHWVAHKLERMTHQHELSHGEAVAIGVAMDAHYSVLAGLLPAGEDLRVHHLLSTLGFKLWNDQLETRTAQGRLAVLQGLADFREHLGGELTITLLDGIGKGIEVHEINDDWVTQSIAWLKQRC
jgi:3-dehydroquinate synthase